MWKPTTPGQTPAANPTPNTNKPNQEVEKVEKNAMSTNPMNTSEPTPASAPRNANMSTNEQATIGKSLIIKGEVSGSESLYIDGRVEGSINLPGNRLTVGRNGQVNANVNAREIVVIGKVRGNLNASDRVDIRSEGSLTGDVVAQRISIEDGAFFKGGIDIQKPNQKANGEARKMEPTVTPETEKAAAAAARA
jgi:cytoskeletal protein CcmA (bactofilin family)